MTIALKVSREAILNTN